MVRPIFGIGVEHIKETIILAALLCIFFGNQGSQV